MKPWPPFGTPDGTPWQNGNPSTGQRGSIIDARAIDHPQTEIANAIIALGLTPDANNLQQLGQAIQNAIAAATGGGDVSQFVTMATARARLQIYPEVMTADGRLTITSPSSGTLFVSPTGAIRHRGIFDVEMSAIDEIDRTFAMLPSKVAHIRWSPSSGLQRLYLDDEAYNPSGLPEADLAFDSGYDRALLARATTDSSANVTITSLSNLPRLAQRVSRAPALGDGGSSSSSGPTPVHDIGWGRTPFAMIEGLSPPGGGRDTDLTVRISSRSRYAISVYSWAWQDGGPPHASYGYDMQLLAV
ncbi:MAG: hypothetical protein LAT55_13285 [Opitutales bacterium]|nr:hypothetical protein [Opitutales bacterium]